MEQLKILKKIAWPMLFLIMMPFFAQKAYTENTAEKYIYVIPLTGTVDPGMAAFIKRAIEQTNDSNEPYYVFEMDTFGGRVDAALNIVETILNVSNGKTIAYVKSKAISAGALIALSCSELVMKKNTTIGDCAPITYSKEGPKPLGEKFQSPLRAKFRTLGKRNGYPESLAESMVSKEMAVFEVILDGKKLYLDSIEYDNLNNDEKNRVTSKKTIVAKGELLTMDDTEAHQYGFSKMSVSNIEEIFEKMDLTRYKIIRVEETWSETFVRFIGTVAPFLLMIGLAALYAEIKAPGFGAPGIVGIICLALVFLGQYIVGLADYTELLFWILGFILLGFEIFVLPGFGIAGISGFILIAIGAVLALQDFVIPDPSYPWEAELMINNLLVVLGSFLLGIVVAILSLRYILPKMGRFANGPYLSVTLKNAHADSKEVGNARVGQIGTALSFLRPSGKIKIKNDIFDAVTQGEYIEKESKVKILDIKGNNIIVIQAENKE